MNYKNSKINPTKQKKESYNEQNVMQLKIKV